MQSSQGSPFASTGGVTAADIESIKTRIDNLEKNIMAKFDLMKPMPAPVPVASTPTVSPVSGLSQILPTPVAPPVDLASIFPKAGGSRRFTRSKRSKRSKRYRKK